MYLLIIILPLLAMVLIFAIYAGYYSFIDYLDKLFKEIIRLTKILYVFLISLEIPLLLRVIVGGVAIILLFCLIYIIISTQHPLIYCTDILHEKDLLIQKISSVAASADYFKEQLLGADQNLKDLVNSRGRIPEDKYTKLLADANSAVQDCKTNYRSELRALKYYQTKLESGDYDTSLTPTVQKRKFNEE